MAAYARKKVLITGGLGFIGSHLASSLVDLGAEVTLVDSLIPEYGGNINNVSNIQNSIKINIADVRDKYAMEYLVDGTDYIFNLAGQTSHSDSMLEPMIDLEINAKAQLSILEACRKINRNVKIVFASTRQVYGKPLYLPVDEKHPISPVDVNGINKLAGEWYHILYNNVHGIRGCALRLTNTYGPNMRIKDARQTFVGIWIRRLIEGNTIQVYGDGLQLRDFNFVDDCVNALLKAGLSESVNGKIYNLGSSEVISLIDLARKMVAIWGKGEVELVPFPPERKVIDIGNYYSNYDLINNDLNWSPGVPLNEGLVKTFDYYSSHIAEYI